MEGFPGEGIQLATGHFNCGRFGQSYWRGECHFPGGGGLLSQKSVFQPIHEAYPAACGM